MNLEEQRKDDNTINFFKWIFFAEVEYFLKFAVTDLRENISKGS